jgi:hypothetical protein
MATVHHWAPGSPHDPALLTVLVLPCTVLTGWQTLVSGDQGLSLGTIAKKWMFHIEDPACDQVGFEFFLLTCFVFQSRCFVYSLQLTLLLFFLNIFCFKNVITNFTLNRN